MLPALAASAALLGAAAPASAAPPQPFGHGCALVSPGVRVCGSEALSGRVPSFDGVPLDVDVTLPATGDGPFPTVVMLHAYGGEKRNLTSADPAGREPDGTRGLRFHWSNVYLARRGFAVVTYSSRGFGRSCGVPATRTADCRGGWTHVTDQRYEARDTQHLLGRLVDDGVARADALGVTGVDAGAAQAIELAMLRDRVRLPAGGFAPWRSPGGRPLAIAAAWARYGWSDLTSALAPNGRYLDFRPHHPSVSRVPPGVVLQTGIRALATRAGPAGFLAPAGADPTADVHGWIDALSRDDPRDGTARAVAAELSAFHGGYVLGGPPAPLLLEAGWADDVIPLDQALRLAGRVRTDDPAAPVTLLLGDVGHSRGAQSTSDTARFADRGTAFLEGWLARRSPQPLPGVEVSVQRCPRSAQQPRYSGGSWAGLARGAARVRSRPRQAIKVRGVPPGTHEPVPGRLVEACEWTRLRAAPPPGTAQYAWHTRGLTLVGRPTVAVDVNASARGTRFLAALYDATRGGRWRRVTHAVVRIEERGRQRLVFQLNGAGYRVRRGHYLVLRIAGNVHGLIRRSRRSFRVSFRDLALELPTRQRPNGRSIGRRSRRYTPRF